MFDTKSVIGINKIIMRTMEREREREREKKDINVYYIRSAPPRS